MPDEKVWLESVSRRNSDWLEIPVQWEELGPFDIPEEISEGGKAIPKYALNRGNGTGRVNNLLIDPYTPGRIFACSPTGGLFVSNNKGETWQNAGTDKLPVSGVAAVTVNQADPSQWIIATGDGDDNFMFSNGVWRTDNAGESWTDISGNSFRKALPLSEIPWEYTRTSDVFAHP